MVPVGAAPLTVTAVQGRYGSIIAVPTMSRWWRSRTDPQRIDLYTRSSFYSLAVGLPFIALLMVSSSVRAPVLGVAVYLACAVATAVAGVLIIRQALANEPQDFRALASSLRQTLAGRSHTPAGALVEADRVAEKTEA